MPEALTTSRLWRTSPSLERPERSAHAPGGPRSKALTGFCGSGTRWALPLSPPRRQDPPSRSFQELPRISEHIRVCVRIRPLSSDEAHDGELPSIVPGPQGSGLLKLLLLEMHGNRRLSTSDATGELRSHSSLVRSWPKTWEFDWVISGRGSQASVYNLFGQYLVQNAVEGFHSCVIACGPCGSGKSHTIFGGRQQEQQGLVPRVAEGIFRLLRSKGEKHIVKFSYLELYNERLRDLLVPQRSSPPYLRMPPLEVRQHPRVGVFVGNLSWNVVTSVADVLRLMDFGHKMRAVGCTNINAASSRSHGVATLQIEQLIGREDAKRRWAQLQTVDLAGAARMDQIGESEVRQRESRLINTSLLTLGLVIKRLSAQDQGNFSPGRGPIGCRDNKLTYLLSDSLLGSCRTVMCACVSPASSVVADTESALHFAANARKVFTHPMKNEEPKNETAYALRRELDQLARELATSENTEVRRELSDRLTTAQLLSEQHGSWEELEAKSKELEVERRHLLNSLGLLGSGLTRNASTTSTKTARGTQTSRKFPSGGLGNGSLRADEEPCLVNICDDPLLTGCLRYSLPAQRLVHIGSSSSCQVHVDGLGIKPEMCSVMWRPGHDVEVQVDSTDPWHSHRSTGALYKIGPPKVLINGQQVTEFARLRTGDVLQVGHGHMFQLLSQPSRGVCSRAKPREGHSMVDPGLIEDLEAEFGIQSASGVVAVLQDLQPLLDEATDLTTELRGRRWVFQAEVLHRPVEPEIVVALRSEGSEAADQSRGALDVSAQLLTVWSVEKFRERLEALRDLYHEICERGSPWTEEDGNPWEDKSDGKRTAMDKGTSTTPPSMDGGTSPMSFTGTASPQGTDDLYSTLERPRNQADARPSTPRLAALAAEPVAAAELVQERGTLKTPRTPPLTPKSHIEFTSPSATSRATTPRPPTPEVEPMVGPVAPVASEPLTPKMVARSMPMVGNLPSLLPGTTPPVPQTSPGQGWSGQGSNIPVVQITPAPTLLTTPPVPDSEAFSTLRATPRRHDANVTAHGVSSQGSEELQSKEISPMRQTPQWAQGGRSRREELDGYLGLTNQGTTSQHELHRAVRGMPEIADRLTERWARKERGLPALTEYKELAQQLSESRNSTLVAEAAHRAAQTPPKRPKEASRPNSRPSSAPKERRPDLSVHVKRQEEPVPLKASGATTPATGLPGQRMEKRAAERLERQKRDRQKGALAKEELARTARPEREELARLSSQRSRSTLEREEKTSPGRARTTKASTQRASPGPPKRDAMPADLFEIPEQLREARRRTSELETQLAELRKRLQLQENRSATILAPAGLSATAPVAPVALTVPPADTMYVNPVRMDGRGTPSRASMQAPVARAARSMSPPRWSQAPQAPGVGTAWTWPEKGAIYAAPAAPLRVASASPPRVLHYMSPSPPRVGSPIRFIGQAGRIPVQAMPVPSVCAGSMTTLPTTATVWFPRTVSVSPHPVRQAYGFPRGEPNLAKEPTNPQSCTDWAALAEPTSSL